MLRLEKVATPAAAKTAVVPERVAFGPPVPPVIASVTLPVNPVAVLPKPSRTVTCAAGVNGAPAVVVTGCRGNGRRPAQGRVRTSRPARDGHGDVPREARDCVAERVLDHHPDGRGNALTGRGCDGLHAKGELGGGARRDVEAGTPSAGQPGRGRGEGVTAAHTV